MGATPLNSFISLSGVKGVSVFYETNRDEGGSPDTLNQGAYF